MEPRDSFVEAVLQPLFWYRLKALTDATGSRTTEMTYIIWYFRTLFWTYLYLAVWLPIWLGNIYLNLWLFDEVDAKTPSAWCLVCIAVSSISLFVLKEWIVVGRPPLRREARK